jgi:hypothetical protein
MRASASRLKHFRRVILPHRPAATLLKVVEMWRLTLTAFRAKREPTTISAEIRPYSIAVTPEVSLTSLSKKITIGRLPSEFKHAQSRIKNLIKY